MGGKGVTGKTKSLICQTLTNTNSSQLDSLEKLNFEHKYLTSLTSNENCLCAQEYQDISLYGTQSLLEAEEKPE